MAVYVCVNVRVFDARVTCWLGWLCSLYPLVVPGCCWSELRAEGTEGWVGEFAFDL